MTKLNLTLLAPSRLRKTLFASTLSFLLFTLLVLLARPVMTEAANGSAWSVVKTPNPSTSSVSNNILYGVSAVSDNDAWTVGKFNSSNGDVIDHTLAEHWNGSAWAVVSTPDVGTQGSELLAVAAPAHNNIWAVGDFSTSSTVDGRRTLIEHFDGTVWSVVPSPNPSQAGDFLTGVTALASNNVWAVGWFDNTATGSLAPLILHWNGSAWSIVTNGVPISGDVILHAITAISASDIWAVGESGSAPTNFEMHWNGAQWSIVPNATFPSGGQESLPGVAAASSKDVWAVGSYAPTVFAELQTLAIHWDGKQWSRVTTPNVDKFFNRLLSVAVVKSNDVWAVGYAYTPDGLDFHTLVERWNGTQWQIVPSPNVPGTGANELDGVVVSGPTTLWAVGTFDSHVKGNPGLRTMAQHTLQG